MSSVCSCRAKDPLTIPPYRRNGGAPDVDSICLAESFCAQDAYTEFKILEIPARVGQFRVGCRRNWLALAGGRNRRRQAKFVATCVASFTRNRNSELPSRKRTRLKQLKSEIITQPIVRPHDSQSARFPRLRWSSHSDLQSGTPFPEFTARA